MPLPKVLNLILIFLLLGTQSACGQTVPTADARIVEVLYTVWIKPEENAAVVKIRLDKNPQWVRWVKLSIDPERHSNFRGSGEVSVQGDTVEWHPPTEDVWLQYQVKLNSTRSDGHYDGYITPEWALFRADDLVPPIRSRMRKSVQSEAKLQFKLPQGWSVTTRYPSYKNGRYKIDDPDRAFDRPTGWLVMGKIGTVRETIGDTRVAVSGPVGQDIRRMDILAFFNWTLPVMQEIFPDFPERLLVVSANDPMWRGALSAPNSLYVHADRPILSGNATSTLIHELIHVAMRARSGPGGDWIAEGLAEYYSLEVLQRSGTITEKRYEKAHAKLEEWGKEAHELEVDHSSGPVTARAVGVLRNIDRQIREKSGGASSLDDVVRALAEDDATITSERFEELVQRYSTDE